MSTHKKALLVKIKDENPKMKTFFFDIGIEYKPGQFIMAWIPGIDEKPFSLSYTKPIGLTIEKKGKFTKKIFNMKIGDKIFIRGPFGNGFKIKKNAIVVAGGCGYAPLAPLIEQLKNPKVIFGCRSKDRIVFQDRFKELKPIICTDDGSLGCKGFTSDMLIDLLKEINKPDIIYTCGPEIMMKKIFDICEENKIECQASLERMMFCGFGICGSCTCDDKLVCKDGPVFDSDELRNMIDFGKYAKLRSGRKTTLKEFTEWRSE